MNLNGRRESSNVSDRRGGGGGKKLGAGIGAVIIAAIIAWIQGAIRSMSCSLTQDHSLQESHRQHKITLQQKKRRNWPVSPGRYSPGPKMSGPKIFAQMGKEYEPPTLVLYTDAVRSACGDASASVGPFYCSADEKLYIDLSFFRDMRKTLGADGDFAYAYVIAHEVGHHVQHLLGTLDEAHSQMNRLSETEANSISVRIELQADFLAGVWAYHDNEMFDSIEDGDLEEALDASMKIGDDYLQKRARGYSVPDSFTHGTSAQRTRWLKKGLTTGDITQGDTFSIPYSSL